MAFSRYLIEDKIYRPIQDWDIKKGLDNGAYTIHQDRNGNFWFEKISLVSDKIIDLPTPEFENITNEIDLFLTPETKNKFKNYGFLYKRSMILFGSPGTGKTVIVNRIAKQVINNNGIVLFNPDPDYLTTAYNILNEIEPTRTVMVIFEEFDELVKHNESVLLTILDGEIQKENVIYVATTNYIEKVPTRLLRPGRFSSTIEIHFPNKKARSTYLKIKMPDISNTLLNNWVELSDGLSIDELKETVLAVNCLNQKLDDTINKLKKLKKSPDYKEISKTSEADDDNF